LDAAKHLGWWLVFCVVYADIGTSIYYVPGILYQSIGNLAALAQVITLGVFVSIARKYAEICSRCPDGGGVVSICTLAFPRLPVIALVGGCLITIDYFLTSAISGVSGIYYLQALVGFDKGLAVPITIACLAFLLFLNVVGLKESAQVASTMAAFKLLVNVALVIVAALYITGRGAWSALWEHILHPGNVQLSVGVVLVGYADTWLAYSGLESAAQISGAMRRPISRTASRGMWLVVGVIGFLSPLLTAFSTFLLTHERKVSDPENYLAGVADLVGGEVLLTLTVTAATLLLVMACNTAIVGNYHVNVRLVEAGYFPKWLGRRNSRFGTPHWSIAVSAVVPMVILIATAGKVTALGDLYSFGLLGALTLSSVALDVVRWREKQRGPTFWWGAVTSVALALAWGINLWHKPAATLFGGALALGFLGLAVGYARGVFLPIVARLPAFTPEAAEAAAEHHPAAAQLLTLTEARELHGVERPGVMVAMRAMNERLLEEAVLRVRALGEHALFVLFVEEIPGLFYPPKHGPSPEAERVLGEAVLYLQREHGIIGIPIWRLAHDAAQSLAGAAGHLGAKALVIGASRRTPLWRLLRGSVVHGLVKYLPRSCRLVLIN
jgi:amino acid transporter